MSRAEFLRKSGTATAALAAEALARGRGGVAAQAGRPNLLLILTDNQRFWTINERLMPKATNLLAAKGLRLRGYVNEAGPWPAPGASISLSRTFPATGSGCCVPTATSTSSTPGTDERELYDMSNDANQLRSLHRGPGNQTLISGFGANLARFAVCSGESCLAAEV